MAAHFAPVLRRSHDNCQLCDRSSAVSSPINNERGPIVNRDHYARPIWRDDHTPTLRDMAWMLLRPVLELIAETADANICLALSRVCRATGAHFDAAWWRERARAEHFNADAPLVLLKSWLTNDCWEIDLMRDQVLFDHPIDIASLRTTMGRHVSPRWRVTRSNLTSCVLSNSAIGQQPQVVVVLRKGLALLNVHPPPQGYHYAELTPDIIVEWQHILHPFYDARTTIASRVAARQLSRRRQ